MDNFEKVEKLVEKTGVDYAKAKEALEKSEWDMLDAVIYLEAEGLIQKKVGNYSTANAATNANVSSGTTATTAENGAENCECTEVEVVKSERQDYEDCATCEAETCENCETYANFKEDKKRRKEAFKKQKRSFIKRVKNFLVMNKLVISNPQGNEVMKLHVWIAILLFLCTFWITTIAVLLSFAFGYKYVFEGPELGKEGINKAVDAVRDTTYTIVNDIREKHEEHKSNK